MPRQMSSERPRVPAMMAATCLMPQPFRWAGCRRRGQGRLQTAPPPHQLPLLMPQQGQDRHRESWKCDLRGLGSLGDRMKAMETQANRWGRYRVVDRAGRCRWQLRSQARARRGAVFRAEASHSQPIGACRADCRKRSENRPSGSLWLVPNLDRGESPWPRHNVIALHESTLNRYLI